MKILFAYDGSECADNALQDLRRAGLGAEAEVLVMSLADVFLPWQTNEEVKNFSSCRFQLKSGVLTNVHNTSSPRQKLWRKERVNKSNQLFPNLACYDTKAQADSPAWAIITNCR